MEYIEREAGTRTDGWDDEKQDVGVEFTVREMYEPEDRIYM